MQNRSHSHSTGVDQTGFSRSINRRDFLNIQINGTLWMAAACASGLWLPRGIMTGAEPDIAVATGAAAAATRTAVGLLGGMGAFVKPGQKVVIKPNLSFGRGQQMATNGPRGPGKIIALNKIVASADMVAADAMTVTLSSWDGRRLAPKQVAHIRNAHENGLGRMDVEHLNVQQVSV